MLINSHQPELELIVDSSSDCVVAWVKVKVKGTSDLYIGSFYRPPDKNNPEYLQQLHSLLNRIPTDKGAHLWLGGDFNLPDINWEDESDSQYALNSSVAHQLLNITRDFYLDQDVTEPTRVTETTASKLDLFFTSNQTLINKVEVIPGISDHETVFIESSLCPMRVKTPPRKVFQYRKADYEAFLKAFQIEFEELVKTEDVEQLWTRFKKKIHSLMESHIPAKTISGNKVNKPWISKQVKSLTRKCKKLFAKQRKARKAKDVRMYKETKARLQKTERESYWKFIDNIIEAWDQGQQPKQKRFWAYIKVSKGAKIRNRYNHVPHLTQDTNGKVKLTVDTTNESQEVSPFPVGDHKAHINRRTQNIANTRQNKNIKDPQKKYRLGTVSKIFYWRA